MGWKKCAMIPAPVPSKESLKPIGGGAKGVFRPYTVTKIPVFTSETWCFKIDGLVMNPRVYNWEQFVQIPRKVQVSDFHCITGWSVFDITYEGILLKDILQEAGIKSGAVQVKLYSGDGVYTDSLSIGQALLDDVMVAVLQDGRPISPDFGGPVRLIVPKMYAYKGVKWLNRIEVIDHKHAGYWEKRGYSKNAWIHKAGSTI
ncbi:molybdopterin-dependent oxidoreductase [Peribacillus kribbensis]|uniref:molybdopterin-dependent oxidoreductase n=1 Tax=Peribacillus kribbensis TaxID=356658 RepID=UPI0004087CD8|nr:molybdopterin-dependent oxidoreductase [Peribacillus kribbensis]